MKSCIYCRKELRDDKFTLEHAIPQFLGGSFAPDTYKTRDVCKRCNEVLGLFVDGSFARAWPVAMALRLAAFRSFDPESDVGFPLICMGNTTMQPPGIQPNEVCEMWLGPLGEQVFWIRPMDERLYWYGGGNPITTARQPTRAYYFFSERSAQDLRIGWRAFRDSFEGCRLTKIMCTDVQGAELSGIGFAVPNALDLERIKFLRTAIADQAVRHMQFALHVWYDYRFLAKLAIGMTHCVLGQEALRTPYGEELYKALNYREGDPEPKVFGASPLSANPDARLLAMTGVDHAVAISLFVFDDALVLNLNLGGRSLWTIRCANLHELPAGVVDKLGDGRIVILYRQLQFGVEMSLSELIAHNTGSSPHPRLAAAQARASSPLRTLTPIRFTGPISRAQPDSESATLSGD